MAERSIAEESGTFGPDSVIWRVNREAVVGLAGTCALLMQIAHPLVAAGVRDHSQFEVDMAGRLRRTLTLTLALVYGTRLEAERAARVINARHRSVQGPGYSAMDPQLLLWVHATLVYSALRAYAEFVRPLTEQERDQYYQETKQIGGLLGIPWQIYPQCIADLDGYLDAMMGRDVRVEDGARRMGRILLYPPLRGVPQVAFSPLRLLTAGLLPAQLRDAYGLKWRGRDRAAYAAIRMGLHRLVPSMPTPIRWLPPARDAYRRLPAQR